MDSEVEFHFCKRLENILDELVYRADPAKVVQEKIKLRKLGEEQKIVREILKGNNGFTEQIA